MKTLKRIRWLFLAFCAVNVFLVLAEPVWLHVLPFTKQEILVSPGIDKAVQALALFFVTIQLPSGIIIDIVESYRVLNAVEGVLIFSLISAMSFEFYRVVVLKFAAYLKLKK
ncbi:MAG: hypothetical protein H6696_00995 [Deferribacteres bacterium]|nr:hypothetical protein [candidate division KSB1 bacterium]MCB9500484.1 hypothetical protein [Deferribacteres bacterium]